MLINDKLKKLLDAFVDKKELDINQIMNILNLKQRSSYLYIAQLNDFLTNNNFKQITKYYKKFFFNEEPNNIKKFFDNKKNVYSNETQKQEIILFLTLINKEITIDKLSEILNVSNASIIDDLEKILNKYNISYKTNIYTITINDQNNYKIYQLIAMLLFKNNNYIIENNKNTNNPLYSFVDSLESNLNIFMDVNTKKFLKQFIYYVSVCSLIYKNQDYSYKLINHYYDVKDKFVDIFKDKEFINQILVGLKQPKYYIHNPYELFNYLSYVLASFELGNNQINTDNILLIKLKPIINNIVGIYQNQFDNKIDTNKKNDQLYIHLINCFYRTKIDFNFIINPKKDNSINYQQISIAIDDQLKEIENILKIKLTDNELIYFINKLAI